MTEPGMKEIEKLFQLAEKYEASDVHLKAGSPPIFRVKGHVRELETKALTAKQVQVMLYEILTEAQKEKFERENDIDLAYSYPGVGRFRVNAFVQRGSVSVAARRVASEIPDFAQLNLEVEAMRRIAETKNGLVIVAGTTGCGKSTTLASIIQHINEHRRCHIVTIEDPIEYIYADNKAFINQREVGLDVPSFRHALRYIMRQDPDVILIGEMRDSETFESALTAAETGHLVFGTLHSSTVGQTISRLLDMFPGESHRQVMMSLRFNLRAIVCQRMMEASSEEIGLVPAQEILFVSPTAARLIGDGEHEKLADLMRGATEEGMQDFNQSLVKLVKNGLVDQETAISASDNPEQLEMNLKGIYLGDDRRIVG
jgi:twitching motility protein PilT